MTTQTSAAPAARSVTHTPAQRRVQAYWASTPGRIKSYAVLASFGIVLTTVLGFLHYRDVRQVVQAVGVDTVPSIVAAEQIRATLADAHANAVNAQLLGESSSAESWKSYRADMDKVHTALIVASRNITFGDEEQIPIQAIMSHLAEYEESVGEMRAHRGDQAQADLRVADTIMRKTVLPATIALDAANFKHLDADYGSHQSHLGTAALPFRLFALLTAIGLLASQVYLARRTRRIFNAGLLSATLLLGAAVWFVERGLAQVEVELKMAKQDAFDSIHALWQARAIAFDANADESLYLIYHGKPELQAQATREFMQRANQVLEVKSPNGNKLAASGNYGGLLGLELANVTFNGEKEAALDTVESWQRYMNIDATIRQLEEAGKYQEALVLDLGRQENQSNWAFDQFDSALEKTMQINQTAFQDSTNHAFSILAKIPFELVILGVLAVLALGLGVRPRLNEYRY